jgi:(2Fe-2S) ferredoxin
MLGGTARYRVYVCHGANCPQRGAAAIMAELERLLAARGLTDEVALRPGNCNKLCRLGPSMVVYPGPVRYGELTPAALAEIVEQHFIGGQPAARWQRFGDHSLP